MAGTGKYTQYAPPQGDKNTLLAKLYPNSPTAGYVGKEDGYRKDVIIPLATAKVDSKGVGGLLPSDGVQVGDQLQLGTVRLDFAGSPDLTKVTHDTATTPSGKSAGGPANAYLPDITSPGPGKTEGVDKAADPQISVSDYAAGLSKPDQPSHLAGYVPGGPTTSTRNPSAKAPGIVLTNVLGTNPTNLGDSGANG